jgi:Pyruvate/2-oxoacid:ferredoxin oxidoreductase delta subunit
MPEIGLVDISNALASLGSQRLRVYPHQCVRFRHRKAQCTRCADNCPEGAIVWGESAEVDAKKCTSCGLCAAVCPTGVFEASSPSNSELLRQIDELAKVTSAISFACPHVAGEEARGVIRVSCLGRLDASILVGAAASGTQQVHLVDSECEHCPGSIGHTAAEHAVAESNGLLQACGSASRVEFVDWSDVLDQPTHIKKQKVGIHTENVPGETAQTIKPVEKGELPVRVPEKRQLLLSSLKRISDHDIKTELDTNLWATVSIKESCTGCRMCAFFCPTGALVKFVEDGKPGLTFKYAECTNCGLCREICYTTSIELAAHVDLTKVIAEASEIVWSNTQTCSREEKLRRLRMFKP